MKVMEANEVVPLVRLFLTGNIYADQIMKDVQYLVNQRTVDAEQVVHCFECKHARKSEDAFDLDGITLLCECPYMAQPHRWHAYCSWAKPKRKKGEATHD